MPTAMILTLLLGLVLGAVNGYLVAYVGLPSLAVTIGTLALYRGLAEGLIQTDRIAGFPPPWQDWPTERIGDTNFPKIVIPVARAGRRVRRAAALHVLRPRASTRSV